LPFTVREGAAAVHMPACINRIFGNDPDRGAHPTVPDALVAVSRRAGMPLWIPDDVGGHCCGTPWSSKGFERGQELMAQRISGALARWSDGGKLPVVIDATSCSHGLISDVAPEGVEILDSIAWVHDHLLERLVLARTLRSVVVHPTCSAVHLGLSRKLGAIAAAIADEVVIPASTGCCGMAGDRGWLHPELPQSALRELARELEGHAYDACVSSNRTCEVALREVTGRPYSSFVLALEELTR
jgi:D-lactate dehydrogenase